MMREITRHEQNVANKQIQIQVMDEPGPGGANYRYDVYIPYRIVDAGPVKFEMVTLEFQDGPVDKDGNGVNGLTHEVLLAIIIDRLEGFQRGPYKCLENEAVCQNLKSALMWLQQRTNKRVERGVEGTIEV